MHIANSRFRSAKSATGKGPGDKPQKPKGQRLEQYIASRDFTGAVALLEFQKKLGQQIDNFPTNPWLAYCLFHLGEHERAAEVYKEMIAQDTSMDPSTHLYMACCLFFLGRYAEAQEEAKKGPNMTLQNRLLLHIALKMGDEDSLYSTHSKLKETLEDQLSLAAVHYLRHHYQEATEIYKKVLYEQRTYMALNVYVALCYYKLDYYDVSTTCIDVYLTSDPDSATAINIKACDAFKLFSGRHAELELKPLLDAQVAAGTEHVLLKHNQVVFANGERALQVLPPLVNTIPEARLNLVIYYLRNDLVNEAYDAIKNLEPQTPQEYTLKGVVEASVGQTADLRDHIKHAQSYFQCVGTSQSEVDTIPGRQCMASCFFLTGQFDDVLTYLVSIKQYFDEDDTFNVNFGIACAKTLNFAEGREAFLKIKDPKIKAEFATSAWLARCHIHCREPKKAWDIYIRMDAQAESFQFLQLIGRDCYQTGQFLYAAKAFDVLDRLGGAPEFWEGKRGAVVGVFQQVVANKESHDSLKDAVALLKKSVAPNAGGGPSSAVVQQVESILRVIRVWVKANNVKIVV